LDTNLWTTSTCAAAYEKVEEEALDEKQTAKELFEGFYFTQKLHH